MAKLTSIVFVLLLSLAAGCANTSDNTGSPQQEAASVIYTAAALTAEAGEDTPESPTPPPVPTKEVVPVQVDTPAYITTVEVILNGLNLRSGPGLLFDSIATFASGTQVLTLGMVPDGSWIKVRAPLSSGGEVEGWMFAEYLDLSTLNAALPVEPIPAIYTIHGSITDIQGNPIWSVRVAAFVETESRVRRDESTSNRSGEFYIYLPDDMAESARLEIVAVNCSSNISEVLSDGSCAVTGYFPVEWRKTISLPQEEQVSFTYEKGVAFLEGRVVYQDGNGASEILIKATRQSDGVESEQVTPVGGAFRLPLGEGTWEVVAIRFRQDGTPLLGETRIYEIRASGQELEPLIIPYVEIVER